jgi:histidinol-phosphate aminotransferase
MTMSKNFANQTIQTLPQINWGYAKIAPNAIDLLRGENPETPKIVQQAIIQEAKNANVYPAQNNPELLNALAGYLEVSSKNLFLSNGSDDAIECVARTFVEKGDVVLVPLPAFPSYATTSLLMGGSVEKVELVRQKQRFLLDESELEKKIRESQVKMVWLANPNNPTGSVMLEPQKLRVLVKKFPNTLFVVDECYREFARSSSVSLTKVFENVVVIGSFSKSFGFAGLRFGYVVGEETSIKELMRFQSLAPFRVNRFAQTAAFALLKQPKEMKIIMDKFERVKKEFEDKLRKIPNLNVLPTQASFSFCELTGTQFTATEVTKKLADKNIFIKDCSLYGTLENQFIRLGIPAKKDQKIVLQELKNILSN